MTSQPDSAPVPPPPGKPRYRVLVVDDSRAVRTSVTAFLRGIPRADFDLVEAQDGIEALKTLAAAGPPFDLVVTDLSMPQMDGLELVRHVRNQERFQDLPVLFLTSHSAADKRIEVFRVGATDYVVKPFLAEELEARIMGHLERRRAFQTILEHDRAMRRSIEAARLTQAALLPQTTPAVVGATLAVRCVPAEVLGGDFYDFYALEGGRIGILVADVSGHGIAAALVSFLLAGIFKHSAPSTTDPGTALERSHAMLRGKFPEGNYATALYAVFDPATRSLAYSSAGHPPPILIRAHRHEAHQLCLEGSPFGLVEPERVRVLRAEAALEPGDRVLFHSDALLDVRRDGQALGFSRLRRYLLEHAGLPPQELLDAVFAFGLEHSEAGRYPDDVTMVLLAVESVPDGTR